MRRWRGPTRSRRQRQQTSGGRHVLTCPSRQTASTSSHPPRPALPPTIPPLTLSEARASAAGRGYVMVGRFLAARSGGDGTEARTPPTSSRLCDNQVPGMAAKCRPPSAGADPLPRPPVRTGIWRGRARDRRKPQPSTALARRVTMSPDTGPCVLAPQYQFPRTGRSGLRVVRFSPPKTEAMRKHLWETGTRLVPLRPAFFR